MSDSILRALRPEVESGYRHGSMIIGDCPFHVEAVRVVEDDDGIQSAYNLFHQILLERIDTSSALQTITLDGCEGRWVLWITPFRV